MSALQIIPTNCNVHFAERLFQTHSGRQKGFTEK
ncbi:DUF6783 domain-containing protein [Blautia sp. OF03-15BH]